ncbi:ATP-binding cassette domain-containing protein [Streptomyces sp. NPDC059382]|uniref:ATP-binding cassette domain-containing protein n=1 Tax=Streptomyces sp. NPDC059382 TaxID=3346816 RepID=UPI0036A45CFF
MALIEARGLTKRFGEKTVVENLSFRVEPGKVTGFLGPNGAGKSTTMRLMLGLEAGEGETLFDGVPYRELSQPTHRVGAMLDARSFHPARTAVNHLRMLAKGAGLPLSRADEVLEQVGLTPVATARPKGFSLGMGQRLGIAAALLGEPDTLILDEPANGLDPQGIHWLREFLTRYAAGGNSVLISSHLLTEVEAVAEQLVVIGRGRLITDLPLSEFIRSFELDAVLTRTSDAEGLARAAAEAGGTVLELKDELVVVRGLSQRRIAEIAADHRILVYELVARTSTLEAAYLRASAEQTDYDARQVEGIQVTA